MLHLIFFPPRPAYIFITARIPLNTARAHGMTSASSMSLEKTITSVMRRRVPDHVLQPIPAHDRPFIENIIYLAQQTIHELNVTLTDIQKSNDTYLIRIPASDAETAVGIAQLRDIETYSPFRILDVGVRCAADGHALTVRVGTEQRAVLATQVDIIRISNKRTRFDA